MKKSNNNSFFSLLLFFPRYIAIGIIRLYQKTLSPDHGLMKVFKPFGFCRYRPTCSEYAVDAITKHGFIKGGLMAAWRLLRCNPWSKGGWDPVE